MSSKRPWEKTIREYLDGSSVTSATPTLWDDLTIHDHPDEHYAHVAVFPEVSDYVFHFDHSTKFKITHAPTGKIVGAFAGNLAYVDPGHRGKGLTSELYVALDELGIEREHWLLTEASFGARKGAHRRHVERALRRGDRVPLEVIKEYTRTAEGLRLKEDYTRHACNERRLYCKDRASYEEKLSGLQGLAVNFVPRDLSDRDRDYEAGGAYLRSDPTHRIAGLRLAAQAADAGDGVIRMIVGWTDGSEHEEPSAPESCHLAFYAAVGDQAIDHIGVRPESQMFDELISRDVLQHERFRGFMGGDQMRFETLTFADASACVRHLRDNAISTITPYANLHHNAYLHDKYQQARGIEMATRAAREIAGLDVDAHAPA